MYATSNYSPQSVSQPAAQPLWFPSNLSSLSSPTINPTIPFNPFTATPQGAAPQPFQGGMPQPAVQPQFWGELVNVLAPIVVNEVSKLFAATPQGAALQGAAPQPFQGGMPQPAVQPQFWGALASTLVPIVVNEVSKLFAATPQSSPSFGGRW